MPTIIFLPALILLVVGAATYGISRAHAASAAQLRQPRAPAPLARELPYWHLSDDGVLTHTDLSYSGFLQVTGIDSDCRANEELEQIHQALHTLLHPLEPGVRLQWMYLNDDDQTEKIQRYAASTASAPAGQLIAEEKVAAARAAKLRRSRIYLVVTTPGPNHRGTTPSLDSATHEKRSSHIRGLRAQLQSGLVSAGLSTKLLDKDRVANLLYESTNPSRHRLVNAPTLVAKPAFYDQQTLREQLLFSGVTEEAKTIRIDDRIFRVVTLKSLPNSTRPALLEHLTVGLPFSCRVSLSIEILNDKSKLDRLKRKRDQAWALSRIRARPNQEAEAQARDLEELIDEVLAGGNRLVRAALSVAFSVDAKRPDAENLLDLHTADVLRVLAKVDGAEGLVEEYGQLNAWLASLPACSGRGSRWHSCTSENATHLLPAWESWSGHAHPALLFENGRRFLLGINPFDPGLDNPNAFMAGSSGAGKSVTTNYLLMHLLAQGAKAMIVDVGGSYRRLIELFGGDYISLAPDADPALNLFQDPASVLNNDGEFDQLRLDFMLGVLSTLIAGRDRGPLTNEELAVLDKTVRELYRGASETPILQDLFDSLRTQPFDDPEDVEVARALSRRLRYWLEGPHAHILNRRSNVSVTSDLAAFDLGGMAEEVRPAVLLIIAGVIWNLVRSQEAAKKVVVFDEVWTLLSDPHSQKLLETLYRTSRKHACSVLSISQSVSDFTNCPIAPALVQNAASAYLLRHRSGHKDIAEVFHLNDREQYVFERLEMRRGEFSEILILAGREHHVVARVTLTPLEYWIATTHPADTRYLAQIRADNPQHSLLESLRLCADTHPRGVSATPS